MKKTIHYSICGLEYVFLKNAPVKMTKFGEVLDADSSAVELEIAKQIILQGVPLRGAEVQFLRKVLSLSLDKFGKKIGLSAPAILKWEKARKKRLQPINEVAVRALLAEDWV